MAASSVGAEPSCRYGAVAQTSRSVGTSIPVRVPLSLVPLLVLIVPTLAGLSAALREKAEPLWQEPQFCEMNKALPAAPSVLSVAASGRYGLGSKASSDCT